MDPNLFHLDYERLGEVLITVIVLAFFVERALALVFEHRLFIKHLDKRGRGEESPPKSFSPSQSIANRSEPLPAAAVKRSSFLESRSSRS